MLRFTILTIFPDMFSPYLGESIMARAIKNKKISVKTVDIRKFTKDRHHTVDEKPYGGGAGMLLKIEPIYRAVNSVTARKFKVQNPNSKTRIILFSAKGKQFTQQDAKRLSKYENLILICGRYEGVDERVAKYIADEEVSVGPYVLSGGELPALTIIDSVSRMVSGVLGNKDSLKEESFSLKDKEGEYPQYTRPEIFYPNPNPPFANRRRRKKKSWRVPGVLLGGNHASIKRSEERH